MPLLSLPGLRHVVFPRPHGCDPGRVRLARKITGLVVVVQARMSAIHPPSFKPESKVLYSFSQSFEALCGLRMELPTPPSQRYGASCCSLLATCCHGQRARDQQADISGSALKRVF